MRLGRVDRRERQAGEHLVEEPLEFVAAHAVGELEPLDAGLGETPGPVPRLELPDRQVPEHDLIAQEGEERVGWRGLEIVQLLELVVDRALARGMAGGVERQSRDRVLERGQESGGTAHNTLARPLASAAAGVSRSLRSAAR